MATFPNTNVLDNFNRNNEGPPPSAFWRTVDANGFKVLSNTCSANAASADNIWGQQFGPDCEAYFTVTTKPSNAAGLLLAIRADSLLTNAYAITLIPSAGTDSIKFSKIINNVETIFTTFSQEVTVNDGLGIQCAGSSITAWYRSGLNGLWTLLGTQIDTTFTGIGYIGIYTDTSGAAIDDFGGGSLNVIRKTLTPNGTRIGSRQTVGAYGDN